MGLTYFRNNFLFVRFAQCITINGLTVFSFWRLDCALYANNGFQESEYYPVLEGTTIQEELLGQLPLFWILVNILYNPFRSDYKLMSAVTYLSGNIVTYWLRGPGFDFRFCLGLYSNGDLFRGMNQLDVSALFSHVLFSVVFGGGPCTLFIICQGLPFNWVSGSICGPTKFQSPVVAINE